MMSPSPLPPCPVGGRGPWCVSRPRQTQGPRARSGETLGRLSVRGLCARGAASGRRCQVLRDTQAQPEENEPGSLITGLCGQPHGPRGAATESSSSENSCGSRRVTVCGARWLSEQAWPASSGRGSAERTCWEPELNPHRGPGDSEPLVLLKCPQPPGRREPRRRERRDRGPGPRAHVTGRCSAGGVQGGRGAASRLRARGVRGAAPPVCPRVTSSLSLLRCLHARDVPLPVQCPLPAQDAPALPAHLPTSQILEPHLPGPLGWGPIPSPSCDQDTEHSDCAGLGSPRILAAGRGVQSLPPPTGPESQVRGASSRDGVGDREGGVSANQGTPADPQLPGQQTGL